MIIFDESKKNIYWNGKGNPTDLEKEAEAVRLYLEMSNPTIDTFDDDKNPIKIPNKNYIGDVLTMTKVQLMEVVPKSHVQKEFLQRLIDLQEHRQITKQAEYIGECGFNKKFRTIKKDTEFREVKNVSRL